MKVFTYFRSSAVYRLRIGLRLKQIDYEPVYVHLRRNEQATPDYAAINPQKLVPALIDGPHVLTQSLAMLEYLDETHKAPPLLPGDAAGRARARSIALAIACDIHPLNNTRVLTYLSSELGVDKPKVDAWYRHWVEEGLTAIERMLAGHSETGRFCHGDAPTLADICLVPQVYNARRFNVDLSPYPTIRRIESTCLAIPAFADAAPERQPDAE